MLMLDDPTTDVQSSFQDFCEELFLWAYAAEAALKIIALGFIMHKDSYLRDGWNILDFVIVVTSLLPLIIGSSTVNLRALRSLRILRPLRTISKVKKLKILLKTLFSAIPYLVNTMIILVFFFLIFAIGGLQLFGGLMLRRCLYQDTGIIVDLNQVCGGEASCGENQVCGKTMNNPQYDVTNFDNIFYSFLMVFQIITMEGWTTIMYQVFDAFTIFSVIYFVLLVFIGSFFLLNLTLAVIKAKFSDNQGSTVVEEEPDEIEMRIDILKEYRSMEREYLRNFDPNEDSLKNFGTRADDRDDNNGNDRGFVWEDLLKLRQLQKQKEIENKEREDKLRKKLFVESWRNKQRIKINEASKRISKFYRIVPLFPALMNNEVQHEEDKRDNINQPNQHVNHHHHHQQHHIHHNNLTTSDQRKNSTQGNEVLQTNQISIRKQSLKRQQSKDLSHAVQNLFPNKDVAHKNKLELPQQRIIYHYQSQNNHIPGINSYSTYTSQNGLLHQQQSTQNSLQAFSNGMSDNLPKNTITFMGLQTNSLSFSKKIHGFSAPDSNIGTLQDIPQFSQQAIMNEEDDDQFWKEINGPKDTSQPPSQRGEEQDLNSNASSTTHIKKLSNASRRQSIAQRHISKIQQNGKNYSQSPQKDRFQAKVNSQQSDSSAQKRNQSDSSSHNSAGKEVIPDKLLQQYKNENLSIKNNSNAIIQSLQPITTKNFSILNLKSNKSINGNRSSPLKVQRQRNSYRKNSSISDDNSSIMLESQSSLGENQESRLIKQNSNIPLKFQNENNEIEEGQFTSRVKESKSHINANHQVTSPISQNNMLNMPPFEDDKLKFQLQLNQENKFSFQSTDALKTDREFPNQKLETEEDLVRKGSQTSLESPNNIDQSSPIHRSKQNIMGNDLNNHNTLEFLIQKNQQKKSEDQNHYHLKSEKENITRTEQENVGSSRNILGTETTKMNSNAQSTHNGIGGGSFGQQAKDNSPKKERSKAEIRRQATEELSENLLDDSDFFQDPEKKKEQAENYEYLASVLKNLNDNIALRLKNEEEEQNEDDFNLEKRNRIVVGKQIHITSKTGPSIPIPPPPPPPAQAGRSPEDHHVNGSSQGQSQYNSQYLLQQQPNISPFEQYQDVGNNYEDINHTIEEEEEEEEDIDERSRIQSHAQHSTSSAMRQKKKLTMTPRGGQSARSNRISTERSQKKNLAQALPKSDEENDDDDDEEENGDENEEQLRDQALHNRIIKPKKITFVELMRNYDNQQSPRQQRNSSSVQRGSADRPSLIYRNHEKRNSSIPKTPNSIKQQKKDGDLSPGTEESPLDPKKQRELLQLQWLQKIDQIKQEHHLIGASHSSQAMQLELEQKRLREKEEREREEKMIREVKNWKLMVNQDQEEEYSSKMDVMEMTINKQEMQREQEEEEKLRNMHYKILHKLKVMKKKKKLTKKQKRKANLSTSRFGGSRRSNENGSGSRDNSEDPNTSKNKERIQKIRKLQQMYTNAAAAGSRKSGGNNNNSLATPSMKRKNDTNTFKDNKSVISFSRFAQGFNSPQASAGGDKARSGGNRQNRNANNSSVASDSVRDDANKVRIPFKMSNRIPLFDQFSSHNGDELSMSEALSSSQSKEGNNSNSVTIKPNRILISQTKRKRERIKKDLLQDQNVKNGEKIDYKDYESVFHAIHAPIKKSQDEQLEAQEDLNFRNDYLGILREDALTGVKTKQIFSGIDILRGFKGGALRLNKLLRILNTDRQDIKQWVHGITGIFIVFHKHIRNFVTGSLFNNFATMAVFGNTVILALDGSFSDEQSDNILSGFNTVFTYIFIGEMGLKVIGLTPLGYVRDRMNIFDGLIVSLSIFELLLFSGGSKAISAFRAVRIFRTFRVLRVTRLLRGLEFMGKIVSVIQRTLDSFIYIALLLFLFIFIFTLLGMQLYGGELSILDSRVRQNFDSFQTGFITVFQIMTMENWNDILYKTFNSSVSKFITSIYLIIWIFIGNWIFLNLFLAILLDGFADQNKEESMMQEEEDQYEEEVIDKSIIEKQNKNNQLNPENLQILNEDYERMDTEEMELLEQEILQLEGKSATKELFIGIECSDSLYIFSKQNSFRQFCYKCVKHPQFENIILFFIVTSSLKLVIDTYIDEDSAVGQEFKKVDLAFNFIFITEAFVKIISYGFIGDENSYLDESWSQIDFFIVFTSIIDMSFSGINISFIKILRLLRTLRPLRFISHNVNMKVVVIALFESVSGILNVLIVIVLIWIMFAILGISLIGQRLGYCSGLTNFYGINQEICQDLGHTWTNYDTNFDNILSAMRTLYIISSLEGWPDLMYQAIDSNTSDIGPIKDNYIIISYFYIIFILVGSFFLVNLFVGVIFLNFNQAQKNENQSSLFLTEEQKRWIEFQQMIIGVKSEFSQSTIPTKAFPKLMYQISTNSKFEIFIMVLIVANIITMGMTYEGSPENYNSILENINLFFTSCFILETVMKFFAFGVSGFFANDWNKFDLFVVISSIIDIILNYSGALSASFLRIGPQLIRIIRVFRVSRLLKLVKSMKGLQKLIETLLFSLPSLINVGALLLLVFFIYSVLGVFLFKDVTQGVVIDKYNNFSNFGYAMITLFRCSTGENWFQFMFDCGKTTGCTYGVDCGSPFSTLYFLSFVLICSFIMLNMFILIIIQYFEDYHMKEDNPLQAFNDKLEIFRITWSKYTKKTLGEKINAKEIVDFLYELPIPLGYFDPDPSAPTSHPTTKKEIAKQVMNWGLTQQVADDQEGYIFFNDLLFACMKKEYGAKLMQNSGPEMMKMLNKLEVETRLKIAEKKKKQILKKNKKMFGNLHSKSQKKVNPMMAFMFLQMAFKAWSNYQQSRVKDGQIIRTDNEESYSSYSSEPEEDENSDSQSEGDIENEEQVYDQENGQIKDIHKEQEQKEGISIHSSKLKKQQSDMHESQGINRELSSRKDTLISKYYSQVRQSLPQASSKFGGSKIRENNSNSSSSSSSDSDSDSNSSSSYSDSQSNNKGKKSIARSKKQDTKSKKGDKNQFNTITEKDDEEISPGIQKQSKNGKLRRIDTLNLKKLDSDFEFGQTNKYQYIKKDASTQGNNQGRSQVRKASYIGVDVSKNSIFNQRNNNKLQKQGSLKQNI